MTIPLVETWVWLFTKIVEGSAIAPCVWKMHWWWAPKDIFPQRWNNDNFKAFGNCSCQCVQANEDNISWWNTILCHVHWWFFNNNTCFSVESQARSVWQIQKIWNVDGKQIDMKIKILQSNNGKKFMSKKVDAFLGERGIQQQISASYSPQ